ncbi:MAG: hypothetical protein H0X62_02725 [Bacteroidetes bacterium]|nr:hypothetical protein [Bacteroidota bacterium]
MKKQLPFLRSIKIGMILIGASTAVDAQVSTSNNFGNSTHYVGWDANTTFPLNIRHNANQPINFYTNNTQRGMFTSGGMLSGFDGLRISNPANPGGEIDIWSSSSNAYAY